MSACLREQATPRRLLLLGTGTVGQAVLARFQRIAPVSVQLHGVANSRGAWTAPTSGAGRAPDTDVDQLLATLHVGDVVIDATASDAVAAQHAQWLSRGWSVVTANKRGNGGPLARWQAIDAAARRSGAHYGDAATVGAGLPLLSSLRALRGGGDRIAAVAGVLSGTLAWLFDGYDGTTPFSQRIAAAVTHGYAEPDPRSDLSGEDVRRKLLILARAAGWALTPEQVRVESLLTPEWQADADDIASLDASMAQRVRDAACAGRVLRYVARCDVDGARISLVACLPSEVLAQGQGCENRVIVHSCRYDTQPLLIAGPGAGAEVTAAALLDDVLRACSARAA